MCERTFTGEKNLLSNAPILASPKFSHPFSIEVDASAEGAGAVLLQNSETNIKKEALALLLAVKHFDVYLGDSAFPIKVYKDHNTLVFLNRTHNTNQHLMCWSLALQEFNLEIIHK